MGRVLSASGESPVAAITDLCREAITYILQMIEDAPPPSDVQLCAYFPRPDLIVPICYAAWTGDALVHVTPVATADVLLNHRSGGVFTAVARGDYSTVIFTRDLVLDGVHYRYITDQGDVFESTVRDADDAAEMFEMTELVHAQLRLDHQYRDEGR